MTFKDFVNDLIILGNEIVIPIIFTLAFLVFVWGVAKYFILHGASEDSEDARAKGRQFILWGLLGMALLFSVWGLVNLLLSTLGLTP